MIAGAIELPLAAIADLCRQYQVQELSIFGSVLREDFRPDSDIDLLVEFVPHHTIGLIEYCGLQNRLSDLLGRPVDLVDKLGLKPRIRPNVLETARVIFKC